MNSQKSPMLKFQIKLFFNKKKLKSKKCATRTLGVKQSGYIKRNEKKEKKITSEIKLDIKVYSSEFKMSLKTKESVLSNVFCSQFHL